MFDLHTALATWRRALSTRRVFLDDDLDELEAHVLDHVDALLAEGWTEEDAFREATRAVGMHVQVEDEYRKVYWDKLRHRRRLLRELSWKLSMLNNYLKVALRTFVKHRGYTFINMVGLAVGLAGCLFIGLYLLDELGYDQHHTDAEDLYRVHYHFTANDTERALAVTPSVVAPVLQERFPEVASATRLLTRQRYVAASASSDRARVREERIVYADSSFFDVFTHPFLEGRPEGALTRPSTAVLTASTAEALFGSTDVVGSSVDVGDQSFEVTGVIADVPRQSHFDFGVLTSLVTLEGWSELNDEAVRAANFYTYIRLRPGASVTELQPKIDALTAELLRSESEAPRVAFLLFPVTDIHLRSPVEAEIAPQSDVRYVYAFGAVALLVLLIACINYMNLATARATRRAREVGLRKTLGAVRGQLVGQFMAESALLVGASLLLALGVVVLGLPTFNALSGKYLTTAALFTPGVLGVLAATALVVTLVAGSYPAFVLTSFRPAQVLKGGHVGGRGSRRLRQGLVVTQFAVSIVLIVGTLVVRDQLHYLQTTRLGFDKEHVLTVPLTDRSLRQAAGTIKQEFTAHPGVVSVALASDVPGSVRGGYSGTMEGRPSDEGVRVIGLAVDGDVTATLGLELVAGRPVPETYAGESGVYHFLLNEAAAAQFGVRPEEAVGRGFSLNGREGTIAGILKDFHYASLRDTIEPLVLFTSPGDLDHLLVKLAPTDLSSTLMTLQDRWVTLAPDRPFDYAFLDASFDALYRTEQRVGQLMTAFAALAILIACLGLLGLAAYTVEQRTREIGVRKVLGASVAQIWALLSRDFALLVGVALVLALPLAYWAAQQWLAGFAYRIDVGALALLVAGALALVVAVGTVSVQALRAALRDPVDVLRTE